MGRIRYQIMGAEFHLTIVLKPYHRLSICFLPLIKAANNDDIQIAILIDIDCRRRISPRKVTDSVVFKL